MTGRQQRKSVAVIGGGPAGLMAAEKLSAAGLAVTVYERMPSPGRKFLMAGRGGLNLTHSELFERFVERYGLGVGRIAPLIEAFPPRALMEWAEGLDQPLFIGSSGRVFPKALKASPLLRAWLARLDAQGVAFRMRHTWTGWNADGALVFQGPDGQQTAKPDATVLALGGASWPKLGSDGAWTQILKEQSVAVSPLQPANCGFDLAWSEVFKQRFAGQPLKNIGLSFEGGAARGEAMITAYGLEGGVVYALSGPLREALAVHGSVDILVDLRPDQGLDRLAARLARERGGQSMATYLRKALNLAPVEVNLLREGLGLALPTDPQGLAGAIKALPFRLTAIQPLDRAISTAGGVTFTALDNCLMLNDRPGVFVAGEMLDFDAPTGGYLLQVAFASGAAAAKGVLERLEGIAPRSRTL